MSPEAKVALAHMHELLAAKPAGEWVCGPAFESGWLTTSAREEVERALRSERVEMLREKRMASGQRLRGMWARKVGG